MTDLAEKAYPTLEWKLKDDMILRRYIRGQLLDMQHLLQVTNPPTLAEAVKTITRMDQFELERTAAQQYSLNRIQHEHDPDSITPGEAEEFEDYFNEVMDDVMSKETDEYFLSREKCDHLEGRHSLLGKILNGNHDQQTIEMSDRQ